MATSNLAKVVESTFSKHTTDEEKRLVSSDCAKTKEQPPIHCKYLLPGQDPTRLCPYQGNPTFRDALMGEKTVRIEVYWCHKNPNIQN